ncbi:MAG TPA: acyl-CoA thioesterase [Anaerolineales bacterium]|nr:acyl-CoA thioesterase [Anaerolineales bacterium]
MLPAKPVSASHTTVVQLMNPEHANNHGNVHGGWIMKLIDEAGGLACMRHAQRRVVTVEVDNLTFRKPILLGNLVTVTAEVSFVGRTSMEVEAQVFAEDVIRGTKTHTHTAYLVYVALDAEGRPTPVPPLLPETDLQRQRMEAGAQRQEDRLKKR